MNGLWRAGLQVQVTEEARARREKHKQTCVENPWDLVGSGVPISSFTHANYVGKQQYECVWS